MKIALKTSIWSKIFDDKELGGHVVTKLTWVYGILALLMYVSGVLLGSIFWGTIFVICSVGLTLIIEKSHQKWQAEVRKQRKKGFS